MRFPVVNKGRRLAQYQPTPYETSFGVESWEDDIRRINALLRKGQEPISYPTPPPPTPPQYPTQYPTQFPPPTPTAPVAPTTTPIETTDSFVQVVAPPSTATLPPGFRPGEKLPSFFYPTGQPAATTTPIEFPPEVPCAEGPDWIRLPSGQCVPPTPTGVPYEPPIIRKPPPPKPPITGPCPEGPDWIRLPTGECVPPTPSGVPYEPRPIRPCPPGYIRFGPGQRCVPSIVTSGLTAGSTASSGFSPIQFSSGPVPIMNGQRTRFSLSPW